VGEESATQNTEQANSEEQNFMAKQKTPHTQSKRNAEPEVGDLETAQDDFDGNDPIYSNMDGAETGTNRSPKKMPPRDHSHQLEPETVAHEGLVKTRTPKQEGQGITSRSAEEESARQEKVVKDRPDAQAGVNHSK
jgi:hypothetical protein